MITISKFLNFTPAEESLISQAVAMDNTALADPDFQSMVLAGTYTEMKGYSNAEALAILRQSQSVTFRGYYAFPFSKVLGYFSSGTTIYINKRKLPGQSLTNLASLILHEFSHEQGFSHRFRWATSLPYSLNRIFETWATKPHLIASSKVLAPLFMTLEAQAVV